MTNKELIQFVLTKFQEKHTSNPVLTFAPGRINLIGEHTDYNKGFVFPAAIDKGIVSAIQKSNNKMCAVFAVDVHESFEFSLENISPLKNGGWKNYVLGVIAEILKKHKIGSNFNIVFGGNIPAGAGLSSSAALENSIVFGLNSLFNLGISKQEMIFISQKAEHNFANVKCGIMDQYASMFGQENSALLLDCKSLEATVFEIDFKDYEILLINTNVKHSLAESAYNDRRTVCEKIASILGISSLREVKEEELNQLKSQISKEDFEKGLYVIQENKRVLDASKALKGNQLKAFGQLLFESHNGLQNQYKVSCIELDFLVEKAKENPAVIGARMMGGGFGGCTINIVKKSEIYSFKKEIEFTYNNQFSNQCSFYSVQLSKGVYEI
ncbi:galactokinase [Polaribacter uvawellassae]|uniref:galactokinase n=1 Tax=Polaribacter uvawellassae TaxID=3133495 RepID=UPI00321BD5A9